MTRDEALAALRANTARQNTLKQQLADARTERLHLIAAARTAKPRAASWSEIAAEVGQNRANAFRAYNDKVNAILAAGPPSDTDSKETDHAD